MIHVLFNILLVLLGCALLIAGTTFAVWLLVHLLAPMTEDKEQPPPRSAVD